jgi:hypothetical protein
MRVRCRQVDLPTGLKDDHWIQGGGDSADEPQSRPPRAGVREMGTPSGQQELEVRASSIRMGRRRCVLAVPAFDFTWARL